MTPKEYVDSGYLRSHLESKCVANKTIDWIVNKCTKSVLIETPQKNLTSLPLYKCIDCGNVAQNLGEEKELCKVCRADNWILRNFVEVEEAV